MPMLGGVRMSQAAREFLIRDLADGMLSRVRVSEDNIRGRVSYFMEYSNLDGVPLVSVYTETLQERSPLDYSEGLSWGSITGPGRSYRMSTGRNPSLTVDVETPSEVQSPNAIDVGSTQSAPPIEALQRFYTEALSDAGQVQVIYDDLEYIKTKTQKEKEELMSEIKANPTKSYKKYLTVAYSPEYSDRDYYSISIYDIITGDLLGKNTVKMNASTFKKFEDYAERVYEEECPFLLREEPKPPRVHAEFNVTMKSIEQLRTSLYGHEDYLKRVIKDVKSRISASNADGLGYWLGLQLQCYSAAKAIEGANKVLEDLKTLKEGQSIDVPFITLVHFESFFGGQFSKKSSSKNHKMNYRLSDMLHQDIDENIQIKYPGGGTQAFYKDVIRFNLIKKGASTVTKPTEEQIMPRLTSLKSELGVHLSGLYRYPDNESAFFNKVAHDEIFYYLNQGKIVRSGFQKSFTVFNDIKNCYMLMGQTEEEATINIIKDNSILAKDARCKEFGYCSVTKQYLPLLFLSRFKEGYISTYYAYMHSYTQSTDGSTHKYVNLDNNRKEIVELLLNGLKEYGITVYGNKRNAMEFLTVRKLPEENTTITSDDCLFKPTPFLGIELEVEEQISAKYLLNGKEAYAPEDITRQCYDALGRDYVIFKKDGSLRGHNPFEIVTVPATLGYHINRWESFLDNKELKKYITSYSSGNCGMHVHINRDSFTGLHLAKFMRFINSRENFDFITSVAQRSQNRYAEFLTEARTSGFARYFRGNPDKRGGGGEKYMAVNTLPSATIEVRIFRGNLAKVGFLKNLEFVHAAWQFTKDAPLTGLTFKEFMFWLFNPVNNTKDYRHLKMWLLASGWNVDGVVVKKTDTGISRKRKEERRAQVTKARELIRKQFTEPKDKAPPPISKEEIISAA